MWSLHSIKVQNNLFEASKLFFKVSFYYFWQLIFFYSIDGKVVDIEKYSAITDELEFISPIRFQSKILKKLIWSLTYIWLTSWQVCWWNFSYILNNCCEINHMHLSSTGDKPTKDRTHVYPQRKRISILLYGIVAFLSFLGIFTACSLLVFSVKHHNHW